MTLQAGYGQWLLPGHSSELRFPVKFTPPKADYQYRLELDNAGDEVPFDPVEGTVRIE